VGGKLATEERKAKMYSVSRGEGGGNAGSYKKVGRSLDGKRKGGGQSEERMKREESWASFCRGEEALQA